VPQLRIWFPPQLVGILEHEDASGFSFRYDPKWLEAADRFALSLTLKLEDRKFDKEAAAFFTNLLPEGSARESLCQKMGISVDNDFELLRRIGRDCAGALVITDEEKLPKEPPELQELSMHSLEKWLENDSSGILDLQLRLSLAGAQNKLPLVYLDGKFYQPMGSHPTTHILKPPPKAFKYLPENEWIQGRLAQSFGLTSAKSELVQIGKRRSLVVERYDRQLAGDRWIRLHQEDFCQALAIPPKKKYQSEGGPSLIMCQGVIDQRSSDVLKDTDTLLRWQIFNVLIGNCDAHGKNLSLLRSTGGSWAIAPLYDLVATRMYQQLTPRLAMSVGTQFNSGTVSANYWKEQFKECKVSPAAYLKTAQQMADELPENLKQVLSDFESSYGKIGWLEQIRKHLMGRQGTFLRGLRTTP
jgi:serine/threonine-protein kinase HipA